MTTKQRMAALIAANDDAVEALAELGFMQKADFDAAVAVKAEELVAESQEKAGKTLEKASAMVDETKAGATMIMEMCQMAGIPEMAGVLFKDGVFSVDAARPLILAEKAALDGKTKIESQVGADVKKGASFVDYMKKKHGATA